MIEERPARPVARPAYPGGAATARTHAAFLWLNRLVVPIHRAGLSPWLGSPLTGYQLLLRCRGRTSGRIREIPLGYTIRDGCVWVLAGYGRGTAWLRNVAVDPTVEVVLPGRQLLGEAHEETDPDVRARIAPDLVRSLGLAGMMIGCVPWAASDRRILDLLAEVPLVRIAPRGEPLVAGPDDPGGLAWVWRQALAISATIALARLAIRWPDRSGGRRR